MADFAYYYVRSRSGAQDIVHDVFVKLWEDRHSVRIKVSERDYLLRAVRNRALNVIDHDRVIWKWEEQNSISTADNDAVSLISLLDNPDFIAELEREINALPPRMREVLLLIREQGLSPAEIAGLLGVSVSTVYNQFSRATERLNEALSHWKEG